MKTSVPLDENVPHWVDHKACWSFEHRGSLGESLLHVLLMCNSSIHTKLAKMLLLAFPNLSLDIVESGEFRGRLPTLNDDYAIAHLNIVH